MPRYDAQPVYGCVARARPLPSQSREDPGDRGAVSSSDDRFGASSRSGFHGRAKEGEPLDSALGPAPMAPMQGNSILGPPPSLPIGVRHMRHMHAFQRVLFANTLPPETARKSVGWVSRAVY